MVFVVNLIDVIFEMYKHILGLHRYHFLYLLGYTFAILALMSTHYFLARKYFFFNMIFGCLQTIICTVGITEKALHGGPKIEEVDIYIVLLCIVACISIVSYCQRSIFMAYIFSWIYLINRVHSMYEGNTYRWLRFSLFYLASLICIYSISRAF